VWIVALRFFFTHDLQARGVKALYAILHRTAQAVRFSVEEVSDILLADPDRG